MNDNILPNVPLFTGLTQEQLLVIAESCRVREYAAGEDLVRQGEIGVGLFAVVSGVVRVTQRRPDGEVRELGLLGAGDVLGEMALLDELPRSATATAVTPTRVLVLAVWDFWAVLREVPDIAYKLLVVLSRRVRAAEEHAE